MGKCLILKCMDRQGARSDTHAGRTSQCGVIIFFLIPNHNNTIKQYLEIAAISPHSMSGSIMS